MPQLGWLGLPFRAARSPGTTGPNTGPEYRDWLAERNPPKPNYCAPIAQAAGMANAFHRIKAQSPASNGKQALAPQTRLQHGHAAIHMQGGASDI